MIAALLDRILGPRCPRCWQRIRPTEQAAHDGWDCS